MPKTYVDELRQWVSKKKKGHGRGKKLNAFLVARDDINQALSGGFSAKEIWEHLSEKGRIDFSYQTFMTYVKRHIRQEETTQKQSKKPAQPKKEKQPSQPKISGFDFNSNPDKEDLI